MEQRIPRPAAPSTNRVRPRAGQPHPAEAGRDAVESRQPRLPAVQRCPVAVDAAGLARGPALRAAQGVAEAARRPHQPATVASGA